MPTPLPNELRSRVVEAFNEGLGSLTEIANRFCVSISSVHRWTRLDELYGDFSPNPHGGGPVKLIADTNLDKIPALVEEKPDRSIRELTAEWNLRNAHSVSRAVMGRALLRAGLSFKKRHFVQVNATAIMFDKRKKTI